MSIQAELENIRMHARRRDMEISHIKQVLARIRIDEKEGFERETDLIRKMRERVEALEERLARIEERQKV